MRNSGTVLNAKIYGEAERIVDKVSQGEWDGESSIDIHALHAIK